MPQIRQLDAHVAELIAAGEVVERPASVVKELVENAIDAGSSAVVVELRRGGMGLIRVTDNGCGIAPGELPTAFLRHATSKLRQPEDLGRIGTLGFRGEALAAIAAVSRVEIETQRQGDAVGASLRLEGGAAEAVEEAGTAPGTTIRVRDLFFNTPARQKFMKSDSAETAAVAGLMQHLALSHPDISFKFIKDGTEALHTPGDGKLLSAVYAALGREFAHTLIPVEGRGGAVAVSGFVTRPLNGRGSRSMQTFFVNGRFIKSQLLTAALEEAYRNQMMRGKFPGCVLSVTLPVDQVDVNVHPAKTQIKFARERDVFDAVYHTVLDTLDSRGGAAAGAAAEPPAPRQDFFQKTDAETFRREQAQGAGQSRSAGLQATKPTWNTELRAAGKAADVQPLWPPRNAPRPGPGAEASPQEKPAEPARPLPPAIPQAKTEPPEQQTIVPPAPAPWRIAGEVLNTYIVCEDGADNVWLIDKHAAHERVNFDRLKAAAAPPMRQTLLQPLALDLPREDGSLLLENLPLLEEFGFLAEDFGGGAVLVREIPSDLDPADVSATLEEFAEQLRSGRSPAERREHLLATMACKASIKGGWESSRAELQVLVDRVRSGEVRYCPHGRPVAVKLTKYELEKMFKRA